jgi:hypothetical protein
VSATCPVSSSKCTQTRLPASSSDLLSGRTCTQRCVGAAHKTVPGHRAMLVLQHALVAALAGCFNRRSIRDSLLLYKSLELALARGTGMHDPS